MSANGTTTVDFGTFPGVTDATVAITGQTGILAGSLVGAWIRPVATADHTADEHGVEALRIDAETIVAGTGFTIHCWADPSGESTLRYGLWTVAWAWT